MASRSKSKLNLTRREFARGVAMAAATAVAPSPGLAEELARDSSGAPAAPSQAPVTPDAEAEVQVILTRYGKRLSDEQKGEIRRLVAQAQKGSAALRSFPLENSDEPAMIFRIYRSDR